MKSSMPGERLHTQFLRPLGVRVRSYSRELKTAKAANVVDGDSKSFWSTGTTQLEWIILELDFPSLLNLVKIQNRGLLDLEISASMKSRHDSFPSGNVRAQTEVTQRREIKYSCEFIPCRYIKLFCNKGNPISIQSIQAFGVPLLELDEEVSWIGERFIPFIDPSSAKYEASNVIKHVEALSMIEKLIVPIYKHLGVHTIPEQGSLESDQLVLLVSNLVSNRKLLLQAAICHSESNEDKRKEVTSLLDPSIVIPLLVKAEEEPHLDGIVTKATEWISNIVKDSRSEEKGAKLVEACLESVIGVVVCCTRSKALASLYSKLELDTDIITFLFRISCEAFLSQLKEVLDGENGRSSIIDSLTEHDGFVRVADSVLEIACQKDFSEVLSVANLMTELSPVRSNMDLACYIAIDCASRLKGKSKFKLILNDAIEVSLAAISSIFGEDPMRSWLRISSENDRTHETFLLILELLSFGVFKAKLPTICSHFGDLFFLVDILFVQLRRQVDFGFSGESGCLALKIVLIAMERRELLLQLKQQYESGKISRIALLKVIAPSLINSDDILKEFECDSPREEEGIVFGMTVMKCEKHVALELEYIANELLKKATSTVESNGDSQSPEVVQGAFDALFQAAEEYFFCYSPNLRHAAALLRKDEDTEKKFILMLVRAAILGNFLNERSQTVEKVLEDDEIFEMDAVTLLRNNEKELVNYFSNVMLDTRTSLRSSLLLGIAYQISYGNARYSRNVSQLIKIVLSSAAKANKFFEKNTRRERSNTGGTRRLFDSLVFLSDACTPPNYGSGMSNTLIPPEDWLGAVTPVRLSQFDLLRFFGWKCLAWALEGSSEFPIGVWTELLYVYADSLDEITKKSHPQFGSFLDDILACFAQSKERIINGIKRRISETPQSGIPDILAWLGSITDAFRGISLNPRKRSEFHEALFSLAATLIESHKEAMIPESPRLLHCLMRFCSLDPSTSALQLESIMLVAKPIITEAISYSTTESSEIATVWETRTIPAVSNFVKKHVGAKGDGYYGLLIFFGHFMKIFQREPSTLLPLLAPFKSPPDRIDSVALDEWAYGWHVVFDNAALNGFLEKELQSYADSLLSAANRNMKRISSFSEANFQNSDVLGSQGGIPVEPYVELIRKIYSIAQGDIKEICQLLSSWKDFIPGQTAADEVKGNSVSNKKIERRWAADGMILALLLGSSDHFPTLEGIFRDEDLFSGLLRVISDRVLLAPRLSWRIDAVVWTFKLLKISSSATNNSSALLLDHIKGMLEHPEYEVVLKSLSELKEAQPSAEVVSLWRPLASLFNEACTSSVRVGILESLSWLVPLIDDQDVNVFVESVCQVCLKGIISNKKVFSGTIVPSFHLLGKIALHFPSLDIPLLDDLRKWLETPVGSSFRVFREMVGALENKKALPSLTLLESDESSAPLQIKMDGVDPRLQGDIASAITKMSEINARQRMSDEERELEALQIELEVMMKGEDLETLDDVKITGNQIKPSVSELIKQTKKDISRISHERLYEKIKKRKQLDAMIEHQKELIFHRFKLAEMEKMYAESNRDIEKLYGPAVSQRSADESNNRFDMNRSPRGSPRSPLSPSNFRGEESVGSDHRQSPRSRRSKQGGKWERKS